MRLFAQPYGPIDKKNDSRPVELTPQKEIEARKEKQAEKLAIECQKMMARHAIFKRLNDDERAALANFPENKDEAKDALDNFVARQVESFLATFDSSANVSRKVKEIAAKLLEEFKKDLFGAIKNILAPEANPNQFIREFEDIAKRIENTARVSNYYTGTREGFAPLTRKSIMRNTGIFTGGAIGGAVGVLGSPLAAVIGFFIGAVLGLLTALAIYAATEKPEDKLHEKCDKATSLNVGKFGFSKGLARIKLRPDEDAAELALSHPIMVVV